MTLYTKYESSGPCSFRKEDFWKLHFETPSPIFWPRDLLLQPIRTIRTISVGDHLGIIPAEFGRIPISGSREEVVCSFPYIIQIECKIVPPPWGGVNFDPRGISWTNFVEDLKMMLYTKYESSGPCSFRLETFWKLHFENLFFDPVTYLCNQSKLFEQFR